MIRSARRYSAWRRAVRRFEPLSPKLLELGPTGAAPRPHALTGAATIPAKPFTAPPCHLDLHVRDGYNSITYGRQRGLRDNMLPVELRSPREIAEMLARRVKTLRLERGWTQQEIADRSGISLATYRRFERSGRISLARLLKLSVVLDAQGGFENLFALPPAQSLSDLEEEERPTRKRGKRSDA